MLKARLDGGVRRSDRFLSSHPASACRVSGKGQLKDNLEAPIRIWAVRCWVLGMPHQEGGKEIGNINLEGCNLVLKETRRIENLVRTDKICKGQDPVWFMSR